MSERAFPCYGQGGMTLRDYFAAAALQGLLASPREPEDLVAGIAYLYADDMLKERAK